MHELLHLGQLAHVIGDVLYVHGGLIGVFGDGVTDAFGHVPGRSDRITHDARAWVRELNAWQQRMVADWRAQPTFTSSTLEAYREGARGGAGAGFADRPEMTPEARGANRAGSEEE